MVEGIPLEDDCAGCPKHHICLGWSPELSANFGPVLEVDIAGLPVVWEKGEGRIHDAISADRVLRIVSGPIVPSWDGWEDPAIRINHKACLALLESSPVPSPDKEKESSGV